MSLALQASLTSQAREAERAAKKKLRVLEADITGNVARRVAHELSCIESTGQARLQTIARLAFKEGAIVMRTMLRASYNTGHDDTVPIDSLRLDHLWRQSNQRRALVLEFGYDDPEHDTPPFLESVDATTLERLNLQVSAENDRTPEGNVLPFRS